MLELYPNSAAFLVVGRSMEPTLHDQDVVLVDHSATNPKAGEIVTVHVNGQGNTVGRFLSDEGGGWVTKDNREDPSWPRVFLGTFEADYAIIGTVRNLLERFDPVSGFPVAYILKPRRDKMSSEGRTP